MPILLPHLSVLKDRVSAAVFVAWCALAAAVHPALATQFNVVKYGAVGDAATDDTPAINKAINAGIEAGSGSEIFVPAGRYRLSATVEIKHADGLVVRGEPGTVLVMDTDESAIVALNGCKNVTVKSLIFDRARLSFTQGTFTSVDPIAMTCEVEIDPGYADPTAPYLAKASLRPFTYPKSGTYELDRYYSVVESWEKVGDNRWKAKLKGYPPEAQWTGKRFIFWEGGRGHCFTGKDLQDCLFEDITYWGEGGNAGLYLSQLSGAITFRHFVIGVPPGSNRLLGCAGGGQISDVRGKLVFENCDFTKIDDDGLDILGTWTRVVAQTDSRTLVLQTNKDFRPGDHVALWDWPTKRARQQAVVLEAKANPDRSVMLVLDREMKTERTGVGNGEPFGKVPRDDRIDRVIDLDTLGTETLIRNCRFQVFRAKCLNLKAYNCTVEGCTFFDSWQPAISAASEWYFQEGPPIRNLVIRNNRFLNCNHSNIEIGSGPSGGYDTPTGVQSTSRDSTNILIEGNYFADYGGYKSVFKNYYTVGDAIHVQNAKGVIIRNNTIARPAPTAPNMDRIRINDCDDVLVEHNDGITSVQPAPLPTHPVPSTSAQAKRLAWFHEAKFGMFIHWGLYAVPAGEWEGVTNYAEWFMMSTHMSARQYTQFAAQFNPVKFDPKGWARLAAASGMKYVVLTAKHHDGFALWDTKTTDFNVMDATPFHRDVVREVADACRSERLKFCLYYSDTDWRHPEFPARYNPGFFHGDEKPDADITKYLAYMKAQLRELLTGYGPVAILWFDNGGGFGGYDIGGVIHGQELVDLVHQLQPDCLVNNRAGVPGDYGTPEQEIPPAVLPEPWETCMTMNEHWGYNKNDNAWKSAGSLVRNLVDIVSKGGNYLLNVGPTAEGIIPAPAIERLEEMGQWLQVNGEAVYGAGPTPFGEELGVFSATGKDAIGKPDFVPGDQRRFTTKPGKLFVILYQWPSGALELPSMSAQVTKAYLLADPTRLLAITRNGGRVFVALPMEMPDKIGSVVAIDLETAPQIP